MAKKRPIIKWTGTSGGAPPPKVEVLQLPPFRGATDPPSEDPKIYAAWISALQHAGSMFTVTMPLYEEYLPKYYTQPAYPVLRERMTGRSSEPIAKIGTVAVFAGSIRSEERKRDATLRLLRHTFIIGTGCYIIPILACLKPVGEELYRWPSCPAVSSVSSLPTMKMMDVVVNGSSSALSWVAGVTGTSRTVSTGWARKTISVLIRTMLKQREKASTSGTLSWMRCLAPSSARGTALAFVLF